MPFACLQRLEGETPHAAVGAFCKAADEMGVTFRRLEVLGPWELGSTPFIRFRTSCNRKHIKQVAKKLKREHGMPTAEGGYEVFLAHLKGGRPISAASMLVVELPELGRANKKEIAALVGVAPMNRDSGMYRGKRMTGGGRRDVRARLFMPTLVAIKRNPPIKKFYEHLLLFYYLYCK